MAELVSTRDPEAAPVNYTDALITGLAPDRGLYLPLRGEYPQVTAEEFATLPGKSYVEVADFIKGKLIGDDIPIDDQHAINARAYGSEAFPDATDGNIAPVREMGKNLFRVDLFNGLTIAFKDFPMASLAEEVHYVLDNLDEDLDILGGTSGDTGVSAMEYFKRAAMGHARRVSMFILSSRNGTMTRFQRAQMALASDEYTHNLTIDGSFDDCQEWVKAVKQDPEFKDLGAVNSINWGRITAQIVYQFYAYSEMVRQGYIKQGDLIDTSTPTGNGGNVFSNHAAKEMGLPVRWSKMATNENNIMDILVRSGMYAEAETLHSTSSPAMDITRASNYERLVYEFFDGDAERTRAYMQEFESTGQVRLQDHGLSPSVFEEFGIRSGSSTHLDRIESIREIYRATGEVIDPHTADAVTVALGGKAVEEAELEVPTLCFATASWVKSEPVIKEAIGFTPPRPERFEGLEDRPGADNAVFIASIDALKAYIREHRHQPAMS